MGLFVGPTGKAQIAHTCSPMDRQFIDVAQLNLVAVSSSADDFLHGSAKAGSVIDTTETSRANVMATHPEDPSLSQTRGILSAMFTEYARAIKADQHHQDPGKHIFQAYSLANYAHDILSRAQAPLARRGCDISPLL